MIPTGNFLSSDFRSGFFSFAALSLTIALFGINNFALYTTRQLPIYYNADTRAAIVSMNVYRLNCIHVIIRISFIIIVNRPN